jgi:hypothetical protein
MVSSSVKVADYSKATENLRKTPNFCLKSHRNFEINKFHSDGSRKTEEKLQNFSLKSHCEIQKKKLSQEKNE